MITFLRIRNELDLRDRIREAIARNGYATIPLSELTGAKLATDLDSLTIYARGMDLKADLGITVVSYVPKKPKFRG